MQVHLFYVKNYRIKITGGIANDTGEELTDIITADSGCHADWNDLTGRSESFLSTDICRKRTDHNCKKQDQCREKTDQQGKDKDCKG